MLKRSHMVWEVEVGDDVSSIESRVLYMNLKNARSPLNTLVVEDRLMCRDAIDRRECQMVCYRLQRLMNAAHDCVQYRNCPGRICRGQNSSNLELTLGACIETPYYMDMYDYPRIGTSKQIHIGMIWLS